jgi:hypothetical protein
VLAILTFRTAEDCLTPDEIVARLGEEFEDVQVDVDLGRSRALDELAILRRINAPGEIIDMTERGIADARWVTVWEGGSSFGFLLTPEANIRIDHEEDLEELILRCAGTLRCQVVRCG